MPAFKSHKIYIHALYSNATKESPIHSVYPRKGFLLHLQKSLLLETRHCLLYLQTQQEGKRNQSMKTPAQSLLGS